MPSLFPGLSLLGVTTVAVSSITHLLGQAGGPEAASWVQLLSSNLTVGGVVLFIYLRADSRHDKEIVRKDEAHEKELVRKDEKLDKLNEVVGSFAVASGQMLESMREVNARLGSIERTMTGCHLNRSGE